MQAERSYFNKQLDGLCGNFDGLTTNEGCNGNDCIVQSVQKASMGKPAFDVVQYRKKHFAVEQSNIPTPQPNDKKWGKGN